MSTLVHLPILDLRQLDASPDAGPIFWHRCAMPRERRDFST